MTTPGQEFVELFLQEASEHLQFLREYSGILQDPYPVPDDVERLYISAHTLGGTSASYGYPLFSEVAGKLTHIFQYAMNATITTEAAGPLVEFISEGIAVLESDLLMISANAIEAVEEIDAFKEKYPFAFQQAVTEQEQQPVEYAAPEAEPVQGEEQVLTPDGHWVPRSQVEGGAPRPAAVAHVVPAPSRPVVPRITAADIPDLPDDGDIPAEILEFFVPEAEEHLAVVTECLLSLEANPGPEQIHRLFRAIHTVKGSAAQVGLQRIARVAHRAEDLVGRLRDGLLRPSAQIIDICLESVDTLKKLLYRQWPDEGTMQSSVKSLLARIATLAPEEAEDEAVASAPQAAEVAAAETPLVASLEPGQALEKLADVLNFSKARMSDKVTEFQEKHEFSKIGAVPAQQPMQYDQFSHGISQDSYPFRGGYSSYTHSYDQSLADFSELEMDRYDDFNILSRSLTEISADITEVLTQLDGFVRRVDSDIDEFTGLAHRLQDEITQARMVPIGNLYTRIARTVRDAAKATRKKVEISLAGAETELDNNIIQQISDPLLHLVRNAVAHGLEREEERYLTGKSDHGNIAVRAYHRGNHIYIEVEDDGRGIDFERVRKTAVESGMAPA